MRRTTIGGSIAIAPSRICALLKTIAESLEIKLSDKTLAFANAETVSYWTSVMKGLLQVSSNILERRWSE